MAELRVHDVEINRVPAQPAVRVHGIVINRVPVVPDKVMQVHAVWITRGYEPPVTTGATRALINGTWVDCVPRLRINGQWI